MTEIRATAGTTVSVAAGDTVTLKVRGPATVRVEDDGPTAPPAAPNAAGPASATMAGLAEAVALVAARVHGMPDPGLSGDVPAPAVAGALAVLARAFLQSLDLRDGGTRILQDLGAVAARDDGTSPDKETG
jgi:hypothetical protein